jgi:maltose O-acetyltransferase
MPRTEKQKMLAGELYRAGDPELLAERLRCRELTREFNRAPDRTARAAVLERLFATTGEDVLIEPPFACDYGYNISIGARAFMNFNGVILDCAEVVIGEETQIGPAVQLLAADHPRDPAARRSGLELAKPVHIGANVWLGGGVIVCPGATIGDDTIVGAGSVVTRSLPAGVVAVGNPCRVLREL